MRYVAKLNLGCVVCWCVILILNYVLGAIKYFGGARELVECIINIYLIIFASEAQPSEDMILSRPAPEAGCCLCAVY